MKLFCIDPGPTESGFAVLETEPLAVVDFGKLANHELKRKVFSCTAETLVLEQVKSYGMAVGDTILETCIWSGRFIEAWGDDASVYLIPRKTVVTHVCGSPRANDSHIRRSILDRFSGGRRASGSCKEPALGTKANPGPLYGLKSDAISALALGLTWRDKSFDAAEFLS